jgi:hypothetical protein
VAYALPHLQPQGFGNWRRRLREDRDLVTEPEVRGTHRARVAAAFRCQGLNNVYPQDEIGTSGTAEGDTELGGGLGAGDNISGDEEARAC